MSLVQEILYIVSNYPGGYRIIYDILYDGKPPNGHREIVRRDNTLRVTLSRLKKKGMVINRSGIWMANPRLKKEINPLHQKIKKFFQDRKIKKDLKRNTIVAFDIPENRRRYRDWLREELAGFGFEAIQKSVWYGPALPAEFIEYLDECQLLEHIRFFKASDGDLI